jgi:hypothetical protein
LVQRINQAQAFRILVNRPGVVYSEGKFYEPKIRWVGDSGDQPILDHVVSSARLRGVESEKGEKIFKTSRADWQQRSIFGIFEAVTATPRNRAAFVADALTKEISSVPIWLCDDDKFETADFIGVDEQAKRFIFVHAKVGKLADGGAGYNVNSLQEVGRQALASLAFLTRGEASKKWSAKRWRSNVQANKIPLKGRSRVFGNPQNLSAKLLNDKIGAVCRNPSFDKEIWMVGAQMTRRDDVSAALKKGEPFDNRLRQFLMHWDALQTACARASVRLKFFCS